MAEPNIFVSYSHDSNAHKTWVRELCNQLVKAGIHVVLDQWDLLPGADIVAFMDKGIASADRVLMICSKDYVEKAEAGVGGVGYERLIVSQEIYQKIDTTKFIPLIRNNDSPRKVPAFLGARLYIDFADDLKFEAGFEEVIRALHDAPAFSRPPLGANPFSGLIPAAPSLSTAASIGPTDSNWFSRQRTAANVGLAALERRGAMELGFSLTGHEQWSQVALYNAIRQAEVRTFGWPIGIVMENREEWRPQPRNDGVYAEVAVTGKGFTNKKSYDYWGLRTDGMFYLLQSLFEDEQGENVLFFNTRIVRVAEAFLFARNLYSGLGLGAERQFYVRVRHQGLRGRVLGSSTPNRYLSRAGRSSEDIVETEVTAKVGDVRTDLVSYVKRVCEPLFTVFEFREFQDSVYEDIVRRFEKGGVS